jgi:glycyl-tRNA synthetase
MPASSLDQIVILSKRRGFVFPGSDIYGGLANSWDYGPLGTELKNNLRDWWWKRFVHGRRDMVGIDAAVIMNPKVWEASGHVAGFNDPLVEDLKTHKRYRADHLLEQALNRSVDGLSTADLAKLIVDNNVKSPDGNPLSEPKVFNLLMQTELGKIEGEKTAVYLRGEIAQSMFVNFKNITDTQRVKLPFGIASVGKAFRNEITPGNFIFRTLEFDLMEFEYFIREKDWSEQFEFWLGEMRAWLKEMGFKDESTRVREHEKDELSHYSKRTVDIEYSTPFGWKEMFGLAYRTDFDLKAHMEHSGQDLRYFDQEANERFIPHVIEPTFGLSRLVLMTMLEAYDEEEVKDADGNSETRTVMRFHPKLAPVKAAVLPLSKKPELQGKAEEIRQTLAKRWNVEYDETQSIGKRYRRQDEIGTPFCITVDFETANDGKVTVRHRDTMTQDRIAVAELEAYLAERIEA